VLTQAQESSAGVQIGLYDSGKLVISQTRHGGVVANFDNKSEQGRGAGHEVWRIEEFRRIF